ncbi:IS110 family transposase [Thermomonas sp. S9]|uniref:IS110 family transposase n=1 Tax=Thermomonas sp. S9 TaxID=2885203 RepID=UPI00216B0FA6|nr:IS110 family transposase [Thermomonas sp. S9]MCR6496538.1 IS110 family transposase [Thermomonas sp. S9]
MALYAACDLHSNNSVLAVVDEAGALRYRQRLPNDLSVLDAALTPFRKELAGVAVESTYNAYWLIDGLQAAGYPMRMVNTLAVPQYAGLKHGDDESDARHLAELMRLGLLPTSYIYPPEQRPLRDLLRRRMLLMQQSVRLLQSVQGYWARATGQRLSANGFRQLTRQQLSDTFPEPTELFAVVSLIQMWRALQEKMAAMETWLAEDTRRRRELIALRTVPGIGKVLGLTILLESGEITRFDAVGQYTSYCRLVPALRFSNGKKKGTGNRKCGNRYLAWAWMEAANFAIRFEPGIQRWYQRNAARKPRLVALKAVAHKLARAGYYLLRDGGAFDVHRAFA